MSLLRPRTARYSPPGGAARGMFPKGYLEAAGLTAGARYTDVAVASIDDAKRTLAFSTALSMISSLVSELELVFFDAPQGDASRQRVKAPRHFVDADGISGDGYDIQDWIYQACVSLIARGNLFVRALDTVKGKYIAQGDIVHPELVGPPHGLTSSDTRVPAGAHWTVEGVADPRLRHWRSEPMPGTLMGPSIVGIHASALRMPQVARAFGAQWFDDGGHPSAILTNEYADANSLSQGQADAIIEGFLASTSGRRKPVVLGRGWKYAAMSVTAEESQFLATLGYGEGEVAGMFGPGVREMLGYGAPGGGGLTYANLDQRSAHLLIFSVGKWISRIERVLKAFCPQNVYPYLDRSKILNATFEQLVKSLRVALECRLLTPNEARAMAGFPDVEWGDEPNPIAGANVAGSSEMADDPNDPNDDGPKKEDES